MLADVLGALDDQDLRLLSPWHGAVLKALFLRPERAPQAEAVGPSWSDVARRSALMARRMELPFLPVDGEHRAFPVRTLDRLDTRLTMVELAWNAGAWLERKRPASVGIVERKSRTGESAIREFVEGLDSETRADAVALLVYLTDQLPTAANIGAMAPGVCVCTFRRVSVHFAIEYSAQLHAVRIRFLGGVI